MYFIWGSFYGANRLKTPRAAGIAVPIGAKSMSPASWP